MTMERSSSFTPCTTPRSRSRAYSRRSWRILRMKTVLSPCRRCSGAIWGRMSSRKIQDVRVRKVPASVSRARASMTPLFPQKPQRLRARRRKIRLITFCICVLLGASLVGGAGLASHAERFALKDVSVSLAQEHVPLSAKRDRAESFGYVSSHQERGTVARISHGAGDHGHGGREKAVCEMVRQRWKVFLSG